MKRKRKLRFIQLLEILVVYIVLFTVILSVGRNVLYKVSAGSVSILEEGDLRGEVNPGDPETILSWDTDSTGVEGRREMDAIFSQMRIPFTEETAEEFSVSDLEGMKIAVLSVTDYSVLGGRFRTLLEWVKAGHSLLILYPPFNEGTFLFVNCRERAPIVSADTHWTLSETRCFYTPLTHVRSVQGSRALQKSAKRKALPRKTHGEGHHKLRFSAHLRLGTTSRSQGTSVAE